MSNQTYTLKRGVTLSLAGTATLPAPYGAWTATAQVRNQAGDMVEPLTVTLTPGDPYGVLVEGDSTKTNDWPIGERLACDVRFTDQSTPPVVLISPTFYLKVAQEITSA